MQILDSITCPKIKGTKKEVAAINVNKVAVVINRPAVKMLCLQKGDRIAFRIQGKSIELFLDPKNGIDLNRHSNGSLGANRRTLTERMQKFAGMQNFRLLLGEFKNGAWPLTITKTRGK